MTDEQRDEWAADVLNRIRLHRRRDVSGMFSMLDDGLIDCLDLLAVAPLLLDEAGPDVYEVKRLVWLNRYEPDWARIAKEEGTHENHLRGGRAGGRKRASAFRQNQRARRQDIHTRRSIERI